MSRPAARDPLILQVSRAIDCFREARAAIRETFSIVSAAEVVGRVLSHEIPRYGYCRNGLEYYVHGVGYTVILRNGAQVHIDSVGERDCFSIYDLRNFLEEDTEEDSPSIPELERVCADLVDSGELSRVGAITFAL